MFRSLYLKIGILCDAHCVILAALPLLPGHLPELFVVDDQRDVEGE